MIGDLMYNPTDPIRTGPEYAEGDVVVRFNDEVTEEAGTKLVENLGLKVKDQILRRKVFLVGVPAGEEKNWVDKFAAMKEVKYSHLNHIARIC